MSVHKHVCKCVCERERVCVHVCVYSLFLKQEGNDTHKPRNLMIMDISLEGGKGNKIGKKPRGISKSLVIS